MDAMNLPFGIEPLPEQMAQMLANLFAKRLARISLVQSVSDKEKLMDNKKKMCTVRDKVVDHLMNTSANFENITEEGVDNSPALPSSPEGPRPGTSGPNPIPDPVRVAHNAPAKPKKARVVPPKPKKVRVVAPTPPRGTRLRQRLSTTRTRVSRPSAPASSSSRTRTYAKSSSTPRLRIGKSDRTPRGRRIRSSAGASNFFAQRRAVRPCASFARPASGLLGPDPVLPSVEERALSQFWDGDPEEEEEPQPRVPLDALLEEIGLNPRELARVDNDKTLDGVIKSCESNLASQAPAFGVCDKPQPRESLVETIDLSSDEEEEKVVPTVDFTGDDRDSEGNEVSKFNGHTDLDDMFELYCDVKYE